VDRELKVLRELVEHHVEEEESTGFSCARQNFDKEKLEAMAQRFQTRKAQLMTRIAA
jgi:hemerythrin-like domain-containing protein